MIEIIAFIIGLFIGSFLLVLADRLPRGEDVLVSRSRCESCNHLLNWYELIPVVSYVVQRGRCASCKVTLSLKYPVIEVLSACMFALLSHYFIATPLLFASLCIIASSLFVMTLADITYQIIPDSMQILFLLGSFFYVFISNLGTIPFSSLYSAIGSFLFLLAIFLITRGRGMGFGDVKLAFSMGLLLGFPRIIMAYYIAFLTGAVIGIILIVTRRKSLKSAIPFGPFLITGTVLTLMWGSGFIQYWKNLW